MTRRKQQNFGSFRHSAIIGLREVLTSIESFFIKKVILPTGAGMGLIDKTIRVLGLDHPKQFQFSFV